MNFLEYYKPINLIKIMNDELKPELDITSMIYVKAAVSFARICKSMTSSDENFYDVYKGISVSALTLQEIYNETTVNPRLLILYATCLGAKYTDISIYKAQITNIIKFGDKRILAEFLGCLIDMSEHLGIDRIKKLVSTEPLFQNNNTKTLKTN